jgi:hypothetical protein
MEQPFLIEYDRALRRKQRSSWRDFSSSVEGMKPTARLYKILAKDERYQNGGLRHLSGDLTASIFTFHLAAYIRPKQRHACRSSDSIRSDSTLLNPSIHEGLVNKNDQFPTYF